MRRLNFMTVCVNVWTLSREINFVVVVAKKATMAMIARRDKGVHAQLDHHAHSRGGGPGRTRYSTRHNLTSP
jgi:hypothetical protein